MRILWLLLAIGFIVELCLTICVYRTSHAVYSPDPADVIIVLGARVKPDYSLSLTLSRRTYKAYQAWSEGLADKIIVCGGQGGTEPETEANAMKKYLISLDVPEDSIFMDDTSTNTRENLKNAMSIMDSMDLKDAILITSDYHIARALWLAEDVGLTAQGYPSPGPDAWYDRLKAYAQEGVSWVKYYIESRILHR